MMSFALYLNGVYKRVLDEIRNAQAGNEARGSSKTRQALVCDNKRNFSAVLPF